MRVNNVAFARLHADWGFPVRRIPDHFLCLITEADVDIIGPDGRQSLEAGQVIICGPKVGHAMAAPGMPLALKAVRFAPRRLIPKLWWVGQAYPRMAQDLDQFVKLQLATAGVESAQLAARCALATIIARQAHHANRPDAEAPPAIAALRRQLDQQPTQRWSIDEMADAAGLSASHLTRAFRQAFGESPGSYLIRRRCEYAAELLDAGQQVQQAAEACGYPDAFTFSRQFQKVMGRPPSQWRDRI